MMSEVHSFIMKLPVNKSHYTRGKAPMRQYMERCTVTDLWKVYTRQCEEKKTNKCVLSSIPSCFKPQLQHFSTVIIWKYFSINLELFVEKINIHHAFKLYSHDLFLYSPVKTDVCRRCATYDEEKSPKSKQVREKHNIHVKEAEHMKLRMAEAHRSCGRNLVTVDKSKKKNCMPKVYNQI